MSVYEKQTWVDGVTPADAEHFNHMEEGISMAEEKVQQNKFPSEAKTLLVDILKNAVFNTDVSKKINNLLIALGLEAEPEIEEASIIPINGSIGASGSAGITLTNAGNSQRISLLTENTVKPFYNSYGLIKIPQNATSLRITASPDLTMGYFIFVLDGDKFVSKLDSGWIDISGDYDIEISQAYADGMHYFGVNFKPDTARLFAEEEYNADNFKVQFMIGS